jgi:AraC-like DNA-binding protein
MIDIRDFFIGDLVSFGAAFMFGLLFLTVRYKNYKSNIYLGFAMISLAIEVLNSAINPNNEDLILINTSVLTINLIYLYTRKSLDIEMKVHQHFILLTGIPLLISNFFLTNPIYEGLYRLIEYGINLPILIYLLIYMKKYRLNLENYFSELDSKKFIWLRSLVYIFISFYFLWIIEDMLSLISDIDLSILPFTSHIFTLMTVYWVGKNAFTQDAVFNNWQYIDQRNAEQNMVFDDEEKYTFEQICYKIKEEEIYLRKDLNLPMLADILAIPDKDLSRMINTYSGLNFFNFINRYRINYFKSKVQNSHHEEDIRILVLALESGFSSKSTFYSTFKNLTGLTPGQYISENRSPDSESQTTKS